MTDLFAGSNTSINTSALIALANASTSAKNHSDSDTPETIDFSTLLSQTMDSGFSVNSQNNIIKDSVQNSFESSSQNSVLTAQLKSNVSVDSFNSSPFVNLNERNSFQSSLNLKDNRISSSKSDANPRQENDVQKVSKETKNIKEDDSSKNEKVEAKEEKTVQENEEGKAVKEAENEAEEKVEVKADAVSAEEANLLSEEESEILAAEAEASEIKEESDDENAVVNEASGNENAVLNFQNVEQSATNGAEESEAAVEKVSETAAANTSAEQELADKEQENGDEVENEVSGKTAKNEVPANEVVNQMQTAQAAETAVVEEADSENEGIRNVMAANKTASQKGTEDVVEAKEDAEDSEESSEITDKETASKESTVKAESKQEKESGLDKLVEKMQKDDNVVPEESLRQKFAEATGQEKHNSTENPDASLAQQAMNVGEQAPQAAATAANSAEETANKIFAALTGKSEGANGKAESSQILVAGNEGASKGFSMGQNNGSGMNNSFSFQSGVNQTYNENGKLAQTQNTPMTSFSELLTKAEMVKTKDGAKVMNIELEQEGIGKLELELSSKDGEVTARLSAESELAKAKLEELTPQIKENLIEKGVNLTQINVDVSSKDADGNGDKYLNSGRKRSKSNRLNGIEGNSVKEIVEKRILPNLRREALNIKSVDITV
ncbi:MAG: flagellar hook-length control protein FliK [Candidatus Riflebacteria bacterium]|nr:flagellar hook-length control protein FliK [Candidatus Riflebacteria bacterium]